MEYSVVRSNRRTVSIAVKGGKVVVYAPLAYPQDKIDAFVIKHRVWIARRVKEQAEAFAPDFADGSVMILLGKERIIRTGRTALTESEVFLPAEGREEALTRLMRKLARERMTRLIAEIAAVYKFHYEKLTITSARTRWGSCNTRGTIAFSFRSAVLPDGLAAYLAVHELCHTRHMDHSKAFWEEVSRILPDYRERRKALKGYSWAMKCL